jgi:Divergent InlB B-repeat domain
MLYRSMKCLWIRLLAACIFALVSTPVPTGASQEMGRVYVVKTDPSNPASVFAAAQQGVFASTDAGATWTATSLTQPTIALAIAPVTPTTVYAGTDLGLFKSSDGGTTWSPAGVSNPVSSVEIDPAIPTTLYASIGSQIIKSPDGGANWTSVGPAGFVAIVASPPLTLYVGSKSMGGIDVASSIDGGSTWITASVSNPDPGFSPLWVLDFALTINPTIATTAYVASSGYRCDGDGCFTIGTISQSTDGGATWFAVEQVPSALGYYGSWVWPQIGVTQVVVDPLQSNIFYAAWSVFCDQNEPFCANFGIVSDAWLSRYGGGTGPRPTNPGAWALWFDLLNPTVLYAATASGVLQSTDGGVTWSAVGSPPPAQFTLSLSTVGSGTIAADPQPVSGTYTAGTVVNLSATPAANFQFAGWSGACSGTGACSVTMDAAKSVTATFAVRQFVLTLSTVGAGTITASPPPASGTYAVGTVVSLTATPAAGSQFSGWSGACSGSSTCNVTMNTALSVTAIFAALPPPPPADTAAPETSITAVVDGTGTAIGDGAVTLSTSLTLSFAGTDNVGVARFECRLDSAGFSTCASPLAYNGLTLGRHTFEVRAVDTSNNVDATPARYTWTVDASPNTTITAAIDGRGKSLPDGGHTTSDKVTFRFTGTDNGTIARFECGLDAAAFTPCTSPVTYGAVSRGTHAFRVRAVDNNGFADPSPAVFNWTR